MKIKNIASAFAGIFTSTMANIFGMGLGVYIGLYYPVLGKSLGPYGDIYINLLKMCVFPIIIASIVLSVVSVRQSKDSTRVIKIIGSLAVLAIVSSGIGVAVAFLVDPSVDFDMTKSPTLVNLVEMATQIKRGLLAPLEPELQKGFSVFLNKAFTDNIFGALSKNETFQVVVFSIIFAIALSRLGRKDQDAFSPLLQTTLRVFQKIFAAFTVPLPLVVTCLVARDTTLVGRDTLMAMGGFIGKYYIAVAVLFLVSQTIIMLRTHLGPFKTLRMLRVPLIISVATRNSVAAIPATIEALMKEFRFNPNIVEMVVPLGTFLGRFGYTLFFAFATIFVTQLYAMNLTLIDYGFIAFLAIFAGISTAGLPGEVSLVMFAVTLEPLGVPVGTILVLFYAIDPLIQPFRTMGVVHTNCALVSLVSPSLVKPPKE